jgi:acyl-CoA dehydrogenase
MEAFGGIGFLTEFPVERWHREALITPIWEGTSNIQALDMLEAMVKKGAHDVYLEDMSSMVKEAHDVDFARRELERARELMSWFSSLSPGEAEFNSKEFLRDSALIQVHVAYGHRLIPVPPHPARGFIGLGGVQGHPRGPTS